MHTFIQKHQPQKPGPTSLTRPSSATFGPIQRKHSMHQWSRTVGNQAVGRMLQAEAGNAAGGVAGMALPPLGYHFNGFPIHPSVAGALQTKLAISQPGDAYEQEAERISEQVMRMSVPTSHPLHNAPATLQRKCAECASGEELCPACAEEEQQVQRKSLASQISPLLQRQATGEAAAETETLQAQAIIRSPGQPLDLATRAFMEPRFGYDFSQVRIHTDENAVASAQALNAQAYTVGRDIVFGRGHFDAAGAAGRQLLAHELTHVIQQTGGRTAPTLARQPANAEKESPKAAPQAAPKPPKCHTGCAQRWGQDTTCSKWGFFQGVAEHGEGKNWRSISCCNSWPLSVEDYARTQLGVNGAASCTAQHEREIATVSSGENEVQVLCSDTIPSSMFGETTKASDCTGSIAAEVLEMSPKAMQDLSGQLAHALHVKVCYSGTKEDLCLHNGPGANSFPTIAQCLTRGCTPWEGTPTSHKDSGWPRV